jgi:amino acid transporter
MLRFSKYILIYLCLAERGILVRKLHREMGTFALLMTGVGSIIGSGWLFGAWKAAQVAGPAALLAWAIGMIVIMFIGLTFAELGAMFPQSGGMVRYSQYSHGSLVGFISGWANWIAIVSVIPIEAEASIQYMSSWSWDFAKSLYDGTSLSGVGLFLAAILVVIYFFLNYWTVKLFARANTLITVFKFGVPALTAGGLIYAGFHASNFTELPGGFMPNGWSSVLTAIATSGVVFAFNGFQSPVNLAGEVRNPNRAIPVAVIGSVLLAGVIYLLLQAAFIGALQPDMLSHGWSGIAMKSPFADLAIAWGLNWLAIVLFADAFISPSGTGITYTATTARMIQGMEDYGYFPKMFGAIHPFYGVPRGAMWLNLGVSFVFLFLFRGWGTLVGVISVATLISYVTGPVAVVTLRRTAAQFNRPFRLKGLQVAAPLAFVFASLILYWATWPLTGEVIFVIIFGLPLYFYSLKRNGTRNLAKNVKAGIWLITYLFYMGLISYLGSSKFGGSDVIAYGADMVVVALSSLVFYAWGVKSGWKSDSMGLAEEANREAAQSVESKKAVQEKTIQA